jgi:hypothetical protein
MSSNSGQGKGEMRRRQHICSATDAAAERDRGKSARSGVGCLLPPFLEAMAKSEGRVGPATRADDRSATREIKGKSKWQMDMAAGG